MSQSKDSYAAAAILRGRRKDPEFKKDLEQVLEKLAKIRSEDVALSAERVENRLTLGIGKGPEGKAQVVVLVAREATAWRKVQDLGDLARVVVIKAGLAQSAEPGPQDEHEFPNHWELRPGLSICGERSYAGTVGCVVRYGRWRGLTSAAHVLALSSLTRRNQDRAWIPGVPDAARVDRRVVGNLWEFANLKHHSEAADAGEATNPIDIAVVKVTTPPGQGGDDDDDVFVVPDANRVPKPGGGENEMMSIRSVVPATDLEDYIGESVYKVGRTTGFTASELEQVKILEYPVRLPNNRNYLFENLAAARRENLAKRADTDPDHFSEAGDSGALVYTAAGEALGFIVGASADFTFILPAEKCLKEVGVKMLLPSN